MLLTSDCLGQSANWHRSFAGKTESVAFNPLSNGRILFLASSDSIGIYRSDDGGLNWVQFADGLEPFASSGIRQILVLPSDTSIVIAVSGRKLYRSTNGGRSFAESPGLGGIQGEDIAYQEASDIIYYGQNFAGPTWESTNRGLSWIQTGPANQTVGLCTLAVSPSIPPILLAGSEDGIIARSMDQGAFWDYTQYPDTGSDVEAEVPKIVFDSHSDEGTAIATRWLSESKSVVKTIDGGLSFTPLPFPSPYAWALDVDQRRANELPSSSAAFPGPARFWVGLFGEQSDTATNSMVQETTDGGLTWHSTHFPAGEIGNNTNPITRNVSVLKFDTSSNTLAAATSSGLYLLNPPLSVTGNAVDSSDLTAWLSDSRLFVTSQKPLGSLRLYDCLGRIVRRFSTSDLQTSIPTDKLSEGFYILEQNGSLQSAKPLLLR